MFTVELYARIRRAVMIEGLSRREAAQRFGVHRNTIAKMLLYAVPPGYRRRERPVSKKLHAVEMFLQSAQPPLITRFHQFVHEASCRHEGHAVALLTGRQTQRQGNMGFTRT